MAEITEVISAQLFEGGTAAAPDNMNVVCIMTQSQSGPINTANRYALYGSLTSVKAEWPSNSDVVDFATAFFGVSPNPVKSGGILVVGYWRGASEDTPATAGELLGAKIDTSATLSALQQISDGTMDILTDLTTENLTGLDFREVSSIEEAAAVIDTALVGASAAMNSLGDRLVITSSTTGATSVVGFATDPGTGTFIGTLFGINSGSGAVSTDGVAAGNLLAETKIQGLDAVKAVVNFKGVCFIDALSSGEVPTIAAWAQASNVLFYETFSDPSNLEVDVTNPVWNVIRSGQSNFRMMYSKAGNRKFGATYMARNHVVNFSAANSTLTMNLKELPIPAEDYSDTEISKAKTVGLDIYTTIKLTPVILTSGANDFVDNRYNLMAFIDAVQTDMFNLHKTTATKIAQTEEGVQAEVDQGEKTTSRFVTAGFIAPGTWNSPDTFGDEEVFKRNIATVGYYWLAGSLADQPVFERDNRISPVLQVAIKNAGAIHKADIIISFNR